MLRNDVRFEAALTDPSIAERVERMETMAAEVIARVERGEVELLQP